MSYLTGSIVCSGNDFCGTLSQCCLVRDCLVFWLVGLLDHGLLAPQKSMKAYFMKHHFVSKLVHEHKTFIYILYIANNQNQYWTTWMSSRQLVNDPVVSSYGNFWSSRKPKLSSTHTYVYSPFRFSLLSPTIKVFSLLNPTIKVIFQPNTPKSFSPWCVSLTLLCGGSCNELNFINWY